MASPSLVVSRSAAMRQRSLHQFIPGIGYVAHGCPPSITAEAKNQKNCEPKAGIIDGSTHYLRPPGGGRPVAMTWVAAEKAWAATQFEKGNRLAWPVDYLRRVGWEYAGPKG
jgi:hypothetical protein